MADSLLGAKRSGTAGKPAIVFLHGFLGESGDWAAVNERLSEDFDLLAIDLPGHGASFDVSTEMYNFNSCCDAIRATIEWHQITKYGLVGYSMGGRIALHFALTFPKQIRLLMLISASPGIESESARLSRLASDEQLAERLMSVPLDRFVDEWYRLPLFESLRNSPVFDKIKTRRTVGDRAALARALVGFSTGRQLSLWENLKKLDLPICYVAGELDRKYTAIGRRVADLCPQGKLDIIPGAGHAVHIEQPEELSCVIASFVQPHV